MNDISTTVTLGGGCFWCIEAVFKKIKGVKNMKSGYAGGHTSNPTYKEVCTKSSGHAEVIHFEYDPEQITYKDLINIFLHIHDPTTLNKQGVDEGPQYRSVIMYHDGQQKKVSEEIIKVVEESNLYKDPIVTEVVEFKEFYNAEDYHQDYFTKNPEDAFCNASIGPKLKKLFKNFQAQTVAA